VSKIKNKNKMEKMFYVLIIIFIIRELCQLFTCSTIEHKKDEFKRKLQRQEISLVDAATLLLDFVYMLWMIWALFVPYARIYVLGIWICFIAMAIIKKKTSMIYVFDAIISILCLSLILYNGYSTL
jgi:hypothetical protein